MNRRLADETISPVKFKFAFQTFSPSTAVVAVKIIPHGAGNDIIFGENVQNINQNVANNADVVNRLINVAAQTVDLAKIVDADTNI